MQSAPFVVIAYPLVVAIEAPVLGRLLAIPFLKGLRLAAAANLVSTIAGLLLAIALDFTLFAGSGVAPSREVALGGLVPMFLASWWIEAAYVRRSRPELKALARRATLAANLLSYTLLMAAVAFMSPSTERLNARMHVTLAVNELGVARTQVAEEFQTTGKFPAARTVRPSTKYLKALRVAEEGKVVGVFSFPDVEGLDGKSIAFEPRLESGRIVEWRCVSEALPKYLPATCR